MYKRHVENHWPFRISRCETMGFKVVEKQGFVFRDSNLVTGTGFWDYTRVFMLRSGNAGI